MIRLKSIDNFRGIGIIAMLWLHLSDWWLSDDSISFINVPLLVTQYGFWVSYQFISGISRFLFYKTRGLREESSEIIDNQKVKREFVVRGLFLLVVALIYNSITAISESNPSKIWTWFFLFALAISLIMITPLLNTSKKTRFYLGVVFLVTNYIILSSLQDFEGQANLFGILYHLLYYEIGLHPILSSFAVFLFGTVVGDIIYEICYQESKEIKLNLLKKRLILPSILIGGILIAFIVIANSFLFLNFPSFYVIISSIRVSLILFSLFILVEEYEIIKTKKNYNFLFYFSYYSLTLYLTHNLLYFLFFERLDALASLFYITVVIILIGLFLKLIYPKTGAYISMKKMLSYISYKIVMKIGETKVLDESE